MYDLIGKVALVTGAAGKRGIGRCIANRLAREGADVVVVGKFMISHSEKDQTGDYKGLESVVDEIQALGRQSLAILCDIGRSDEVDEMLKKALAKFGHIDILVNNAGVHLWGNTDEIWNRSISINLTGTFFCSRAISQEMIKRKMGGKIINIASTQGKEGRGQGDEGYTASKFGVIGLTQDLARELAPYKINVNAVCPGRADTDIANEHMQDIAQSEGISIQEAREQSLRECIHSIPLGRFATPEDVANLVAFLASKESDYITGQAINVNGGAFTAH